MEKRPRFNRNGIFRHFPPWIQVWWQRCEAAGAGGKKIVDWEGWEDSAVLLMTGQPIPPMYVFSEFKGWPVMSHDLSFLENRVDQTDQTSRSLTKKGYWNPKVSEVSNLIIIQLQQFWGYEPWKSSNLMAEWAPFPAATSDPSQSHLSRGKCRPFLIMNRLASLRRMIRSIWGICLNKKTRHVNDYTEKNGFEPEHHHRKIRITTLKNTSTETPSLTFDYSFIVFFFSVCFHLKFFGNSFTANVVLVAKSTTKKTNIGRRRDPLLPPPLGRCNNGMMLVASRKGISPQEAWMFL